MGTESWNFRLLRGKIPFTVRPSPLRDCIMKADLHPDYKQATIQCTCGHVMQTFSTVADLRVGICSKCHPFFTGEQRFVDTAGRVDKFQKRFGSEATARRTRPKLSDLQA